MVRKQKKLRTPKRAKEQKIVEAKEEKKEEVKIEDILAEIEKADKVEQAGKADQPKEKMSGLTYRTPMRLYRRIALFFTLATFVVLVSALYFSLVKAEIRIVPHKYLVNAEFNVVVEKVPLSENGIAGIVEEGGKTETMIFEIQGEGQVKEGIAKGQVTLINKLSHSQVLVQTTRLLSEGGILFHLNERINVPANGSVIVDVYADKVGESGDIGPTKFTVPGLSPALQEKVYAVSDRPMKGGKTVVKAVTEADIANAKSSLKEKIGADLKKNFENALDETKSLVFWQEIIKETVNAKPGDERESFEATTQVKSLGIIYNKNDLERLATEKINLIVPGARVVKEIMFQDTKIDLVKYDANTESATIKVSVPAYTSIKDAAEIFDKDQLVGFKKGDAKEYLENFEEIESVEIKMRPFFLRRLPSIEERIKIKIE